MSIPVETGTLTNVLNIFQTAFTAGYSNSYPDAMNLLGKLATLEVALAAIWWTLCDENVVVELLKRIMKIGFFIFVVTKYPWLIKCVMDGFVYAGLKAGGSGTGATSLALLKDPSAIIKIGFDLTKPIDAAIGNYQGLNIGKIVIMGISEIMVLVAFFGLAIGVFVIYLEFYLISVLGLILIPFGTFKYTAFLAEKVFGAIISFGVRLMVLSFILTTAIPILEDLKMAANPDFNQVLILFLVVATIAGLAWHASAVAGGLMSGSPTLSAGAVTSPVLAVGAAAIGAAMAIKSGISATQAAAGAGGSPANGAAVGAGGSSVTGAAAGAGVGAKKG
jgi:type IV secretion system protein TrbL